MLKSLSNRMCAKSVGRWSLRDLCLARSFYFFHSTFCILYVCLYSFYFRCFFLMNQNKKNGLNAVHVIDLLQSFLLLCSQSRVSYATQRIFFSLFKFSPFGRISLCDQQQNIGKWVWLSETESNRMNKIYRTEEPFLKLEMKTEKKN